MTLVSRPPELSLRLVFGKANWTMPWHQNWNYRFAKALNKNNEAFWAEKEFRHHMPNHLDTNRESFLISRARRVSGLQKRQHLKELRANVLRPMLLQGHATKLPGEISDTSSTRGNSSCVAKPGGKSLGACFAARHQTLHNLVSQLVGIALVKTDQLRTLQGHLVPKGQSSVFID